MFLAESTYFYCEMGLTGKRHTLQVLQNIMLWKRYLEWRDVNRRRNQKKIT